MGLTQINNPHVTTIQELFWGNRDPSLQRGLMAYAEHSEAQKFWVILHVITDCSSWPYYII